ncbi:hypothetical protein [uncultured Amnibacterium sp.]|uniref:hypothetical protein n=1 Tax=uncultured Amnibacterium sp. TaxID=1631851 RepID=UPI0035CB3FC4
MNAVRRSGSAATNVAPVPRPRLVDAALVLTCAAAVLNVVIGVLVAVQASRTPTVVSSPLVAVVVAISVLYAVGLVVLALVVRSGRAWGRAAFVSVTALSLLAVFALNALNLAVLLLLLLADVLLYRRSVTAWVRVSRGLQPA